MKHITSAMAAILLLTSVAIAQKAPLSANDILQQAYKQAAKEKKKVFVMFHASWCTWCHKMDSSMNDKVCKKFFDENFVMHHLVVSESKDNMDLENPGAEALRVKYHGDESGIPFWLIFDTQGNLLADSQIRPEGAGLDAKGANVGCPAEPEEVAYFISVLKQTTSLNSQQLAVIESRFRKNRN